MYPDPPVGQEGGSHHVARCFEVPGTLSTDQVSKLKKEASWKPIQVFLSITKWSQRLLKQNGNAFFFNLCCWKQRDISGSLGTARCFLVTLAPGSGVLVAVEYVKIPRSVAGRWPSSQGFREC